MRAATVIFGILFSLTLTIFGGAESAFAIGFFGIVASVTLIIHRKAGFIAFLIPAAFSLIASVNVAPGFLFEAVVYGLLAFMAYRTVKAHEAAKQERRIAAERGERHDRYVRQQLGE